MKRIFTLFLVFLCTHITQAQFNNADRTIAWQLVMDNKSAARLSANDLKNSRISDTYSYQESGKNFRVVYLQQTNRGVPVHNQIQVLAFRDNTFLSKSGDRIAGMDKITNGKSEIPAVSAYSAVQTALSDRGLFPSGMSFPLNTKDNGKFIEFGNMNVSRENITTELMWVPDEKNKTINLAWQVYVVPLNSSDYWQIRIDAARNTVLEMNNLTVYDNMDKNRYFNPFSWYINQKAKQEQDLSAGFNDYTASCKLPIINYPLPIAHSTLSPSLVNTANYRVVAYPAEAPSFPGGTPSLVTNPWTNAPGNATSLRWHNDGTLDYTITRGNNVWAKEDRAGTNSNTGSPDTSTTTPDPLNFDFTPNFTVDPTQRVPVPNQQFNTANLFYWNNIMHDVSYLYSFNEVSGNFQASNQGRGGLGNDFVYGDVQDGSGFNNANFATPADGGNGRMQMFLWSSPINFNVNSPAAIAGSYGAIESAFSTANKLINVGPVTGQVIYYNDDAGGTTHLACGVPANTLTGKIAMIDRGTCAFTVKVKNAQNAGAIAAIVVNNTSGTITMGGTDNTITIPAISITQSDGATIAAQLANNVNVTMSANQFLDGDADNGVICHEYTHGISNRLTGGPSNSGCLNNAEQMGEGISDYFALMLTQNWATSNLNSGFNTPRGLGTYVFGQPTTGLGIRSQKYCTNMAVNNLVYSASMPSEPHSLGEYWTAVLWDMTWNIINQVGSINSSIYNTSTTGGNAVALRLVMEGLRLQTCSPGFIDARNAILQADHNLYGGTYQCSIKEAFRRRGMGDGASEGSSNSVTDQVPSFVTTGTGTLTLLQNGITSTPEGQNINYINRLVVDNCVALSNYMITDTLPTNVTFVSAINGGTYNSGNRVVSWTVNQAAGSTADYDFTVNINVGAYYAPTILFSDNVAGPPPVIAGTWTTTSTPTANNWVSTSAQSHSAPDSYYTSDLPSTNDQYLTLTNSMALPAVPPNLTFWGSINSEGLYDGGVVEISTDGGTNWADLGPNMISGGYNGTLFTGSSLGGRQAFTGNNGGFVKTTINLTPYASQANVKFRFHFASDPGEAADGWYVDDIAIQDIAHVDMRSNLFNASSVRLNIADTVMIISFTVINDNAPGAIVLTVGAGCTGSPYTNAGATQSVGEPFAACKGTAGFNTVWYKFTAPASGNVRVSTDFAGGTMGADSRLALFSATNVNDYTSFIPLACDDDNGATVAGKSILYATGLTPGNTYYIQVDGKDGSTATGFFCLAVDEMTSSMISTISACTAGRSLTLVNDNYTGWLSAVDATGKLIAMLNNPAGAATTSTYSSSLNKNGGAVRMDPASLQFYLDRNFSINNAAVANVNVRFFLFNTELSALQAVDPAVTLSNLQATRQTGTFCQTNFVAANGTNSSLPQTGNGVGTGFSWIQVQTPGFSNFYLHTRKAFMPLKTWLQGAYNTALARHKDVTTTWAGAMNNFALAQPYNVSPFNYSGTETVSGGTFTATAATTDLLDWVLLELRDVNTPTTIIARRAAFIREDGRIVDLDKTSDVSFRNVVNNNYFLVIKHRNHLAIRSSSPRAVDGTLGTGPPSLYDFTTSQSQAFQNGTITANAAMKQLQAGVFGMWGGDVNRNNNVKFTGTNNDAVALVALLGGNQGLTLGTTANGVYSPGDLNMDGLVKYTGTVNDAVFLLSVLGGNQGASFTGHQ